MPVKKVGKHWEVDGDEFKTEAAAENAYKAKAALAMGVEPEKPKKAKKKSKKDNEEVDDTSEIEE
jgi:hypothetical protein